jgi:hypothetical protein
MNIRKRVYNPLLTFEHVCGFSTAGLEIEAAVRTDLDGISLTLPNNTPSSPFDDEESVFVSLDLEQMDALMEALLMAKLYIISETGWK